MAEIAILPEPFATSMVNRVENLEYALDLVMGRNENRCRGSLSACVWHDHISFKTDHLSKSVAKNLISCYTFEVVNEEGDVLKKVQIEIDPSCNEPEVIIRTNKMTDEIQDIVQKLSAVRQEVLVGFNEDIARTVEIHNAQIIEISDIISVYAADKKVFAQTRAGNFVLRVRLYELEERLDKAQFVRINNSEIVNLKSINNLDFSFTGTIEITLEGGTKSRVSRRYVPKIKQILGM
jgi:BMFP domain-containing protein YqiC